MKFKFCYDYRYHKDKTRINKENETNITFQKEGGETVEEDINQLIQILKSSAFIDYMKQSRENDENFKVEITDTTPEKDENSVMELLQSFKKFAINLESAKKSKSMEEESLNNDLHVIDELIREGNEYISMLTDLPNSLRNDWFEVCKHVDKLKNNKKHSIDDYIKEELINILKGVISDFKSCFTVGRKQQMTETQELTRSINERIQKPQIIELHTVPVASSPLFNNEIQACKPLIFGIIDADNTSLLSSSLKDPVILKMSSSPSFMSPNIPIKLTSDSKPESSDSISPKIDEKSKADFSIEKIISSHITPPEIKKMEIPLTQNRSKESTQPSILPSSSPELIPSISTETISQTIEKTPLPLTNSHADIDVMKNSGLSRDDSDISLTPERNITPPSLIDKNEATLPSSSRNFEFADKVTDIDNHANEKLETEILYEKSQTELKPIKTLPLCPIDISTLILEQPAIETKKTTDIIENKPIQSAFSDLNIPKNSEPFSTVASSTKISDETINSSISTDKKDLSFPNSEPVSLPESKPSFGNAFPSGFNYMETLTTKSLLPKNTCSAETNLTQPKSLFSSSSISSTLFQPQNLNFTAATQASTSSFTFQPAQPITSANPAIPSTTLPSISTAPSFGSQSTSLSFQKVENVTSTQSTPSISLPPSTTGNIKPQTLIFPAETPASSSSFTFQSTQPISSTSLAAIPSTTLPSLSNSSFLSSHSTSMGLPSVENATSTQTPPSISLAPSSASNFKPQTLIFPAETQASSSSFTFQPAQPISSVSHTIPSTSLPSLSSTSSFDSQPTSLTFHKVENVSSSQTYPSSGFVPSFPSNIQVCEQKPVSIAQTNTFVCQPSTAFSFNPASNISPGFPTFASDTSPFKGKSLFSTSNTLSFTQSEPLQPSSGLPAQPSSMPSPTGLFGNFSGTDSSKSTSIFTTEFKKIDPNSGINSNAFSSTTPLFQSQPPLFQTIINPQQTQPTFGSGSSILPIFSQTLNQNQQNQASSQNLTHTHNQTASTPLQTIYSGASQATSKPSPFSMPKTFLAQAQNQPTQNLPMSQIPPPTNINPSLPGPSPFSKSSTASPFSQLINQARNQNQQ